MLPTRVSFKPHPFLEIRDQTNTKINIYLHVNWDTKGSTADPLSQTAVFSRLRDCRKLKEYNNNQRGKTLTKVTRLPVRQRNSNGSVSDDSNFP